MAIEIDGGYKYSGELKQQYQSLTPSQDKAVQSIQAFLEDPKSECFVLRGYAGTGKTFLLGGLVKYLQINSREAVLMAPTGRAARVISERHSLSANTIHRCIYYLKELKEYKSDDDPVTYKFYYRLLVNESDQGTVFIVDEASMISDVYTEQEFIRFGSGKLLSDLFSYLGFDGNDARKKIIFIGDDAQLPPVGMSNSPALDPTYLEKEYHLYINQASLTDVVRQQEGGGILNNATRLREMLAKDKYPAFDLEVDTLTTFEVRREGVISNYSDDDPHLVEPSQIIIVYSNAQAADYNAAIRSKIFPGKDEITDGDRIIVVKNSYNHEIDLMNGQMGRVSTVELHTETRNIPLGKDKHGKMKYVLLTFRGVIASFIDIQGKKHSINCRIVENLLYSKERALTSDESKALYIDFCMRNSSLKPGSAIFKHELKSDEYFNALQVKFAYALTCHKAQGGEWNDVTVDFYGRNKLNRDNFRWCYTAITRAEKRLYAIDPPHKQILTPVKPLKETVMIEETDPGSVKEADTPDSAVLATLKGLFDDTLDIACIHNSQYHLQYALTKDGSTVKIDINYNGKNIITRVNIFSGSEELAATLQEKLGQLTHQNILSTQMKSGSVNIYNLAFFKENESMLEFHNELSEKVKSAGIEITGVSCHTLYHLEYRFNSNDYGNQALNYFFNEKGTFTSLRVKGTPGPKTDAFIEHLHGAGNADGSENRRSTQKVFDILEDEVHDLDDSGDSESDDPNLKDIQDDEHLPF